MPERKLCSICKVKLGAIAYHRNGKTYYRSKCDQCYKLKKTLPPPPKPSPPEWFKAGYRQKEKCERCGKKLLFPEAGKVYYVNGDKHDNHFFNLRTICLVCAVELTHITNGWKPGGLSPDF